MDFPDCWAALLEAGESAEGDTDLTPGRHAPYTVSETQENRIILTDGQSGDVHPLQKETFRKLVQNIVDNSGAFALDRLPPGAEQYAAVLSLHPAIQLDEDDGEIRITQPPTRSMLDDDVDRPGEDSGASIPDAVSRDAVLTVSVLETNGSDLSEVSTEELVDFYALLSDLKSEVDQLRRDVSEALLQRVEPGSEAAGRRGRVARKTRYHKELKNESFVRSKLDEHGIDVESIRGFDSKKLREKLREADVPESEFFDIEEREYIRKVTLADAEKDAWAAEFAAEQNPSSGEDAVDSMPGFERGSDLI